MRKKKEIVTFSLMIVVIGGKFFSENACDKTGCFAGRYFVCSRVFIGGPSGEKC